MRIAPSLSFEHAIQGRRHERSISFQPVQSYAGTFSILNEISVLVSVRTGTASRSRVIPFQRIALLDVVRQFVEQHDDRSAATAATGVIAMFGMTL